MTICRFFDIELLNYFTSSINHKNFKFQICPRHVQQQVQVTTTIQTYDNSTTRPCCHTHNVFKISTTIFDDVHDDDEIIVFQTH